MIYDPLHVYGKNVNIHWNIDPESVEYVFAETDGVVIKNNDGEFDTPRRTAGGKKFIWHDKNGLGIADTGTRIGTTVNGQKIAAKKRIALKADDTLQWGKTILQVKVIPKRRTPARSVPCR